ncbi:MAG: LacI family transcriptional regulator [Spirochaetia bacterium]|nr:LacI family transcriptional regulator [Spirochaetia bacterium]
MSSEKEAEKSINRDLVAARAGVSSATVSRVYNDPQRVSADKREAVLKAADELGYTPNKSASSLRRKGTGTITLIDFEKPERPYYWGSLPDFRWFYADILSGVRSVVDSSMYLLQLVNLKRPQDISSLIGRTDGIIGYDIDREEEALAIDGTGIPYVLCHHTAHFQHFHRFSTDNYGGGKLQAEYLISRGSSRPLYITGFLTTVESHSDRLQGFTDAYRAQGIKQVEIVDAQAGRSGGRSAAASIKALLQSERIDGIAAVNDLTLLGLLYGLQELSDADWEGLPIIGYDAMPFQDIIPFSFPSIDIQPKEIYRQAAEWLVSSLVSSAANGDYQFFNRERSKTQSVHKTQACRIVNIP